MKSAAVTVGLFDTYRRKLFTWHVVSGRRKSSPTKKIPTPSAGTTVIDLRHKGIEKLRLTPRQINNGEMGAGRRAEFALLPQDEEHLDHLGLRWETLVDAGRRWLIIRNYPVPPGYRPAVTDIAIEVPVSYPGAQLDMFYCNPPLALNSGAVIPQTQHMETVTGLPFQRWSRHRQWDAARDTLATHLALVDESLRREVER